MVAVSLQLFFLQTTSSESTLICLLAGRCQAIKNYHKLYPDVEDAEINSRLVAYCSDQAHSSLQKAALIGLVKMHYVESDDDLSMRGPRLLQAIRKDREIGLIPFWVRNVIFVLFLLSVGYYLVLIVKLLCTTVTNHVCV